MPHPDQQVWPPPPAPDPVGSSTQPIPALPSAGPLPQRSQDRPAQDRSASNDSAAVPPPRKPRLVLQGLGAVLALAVTVGGITYDDYRAYRVRTGANEITQTHVVQPGQAITVKHISWKASVEAIPSLPDGKKAGPGTTYMKIVITRAAADQEGTVKTGGPKKMRLEDRLGRSWAIEVGDDALGGDDKLEIGRAYPITAFARVPAAQAQEVELVLRPSNYRSDVPTEKLMTTKTDPEDVELRFKR
ncbi:hypothetical protein [Nonomuraea dietziae]|uniref:hypothetical protein n=1 Tax=Nonomuraea dietziae TaxID=65515 RepID=UPI00340931C0